MNKPNLLILNKPNKNIFAYRGVCRDGKDFFFDIINDFCNNKLFSLLNKYEEATLNTCFISDLEFARSLLTEYNILYSNNLREIVEITLDNSSPIYKNHIFLGYDIIGLHGCDSNIESFFLKKNFDSKNSSINTIEASINSVVKMYRHNLNENLLFNNLKVANKTLNLINEIFIHFHKETKNNYYKVAGIYLLNL